MSIKEVIKRGLIVSCQALEDEPLHGSQFMAKMAYAAYEGGAVGIRANGYKDIVAIKEKVPLPIVGIVKRDYEDSEIYITPTICEVDEVVKAGAEIVAIDATLRKRPNNQSLETLISIIKDKYPKIYLMADVSTYEEGLNAAKLGFDIISTTLSGYTSYTKGKSLPDVELVKQLSSKLDIPIAAEGGIWTVEDLKNVIKSGAYIAVIGTAITRPREITKRFVVNVF